MEQYRTASPDLHFTVEDVLVDGDRLAVRWTATGINDGPLMGMSPAGRCVEDRVTMDALGMLQQLGVIPMGEAPADARAIR